MIKLNKLLGVILGGIVNPDLRSLSRLPPVIVSTVSAKTSNFAAFALSNSCHLIHGLYENKIETFLVYLLG